MSLNEEDLIQICPDCEGKGQIHDPPKSSQGHSFGQYPIGRSSSRECHKCQNSGKIFTEQGEAILSVILLARKQNRF